MKFTYSSSSQSVEKLWRTTVFCDANTDIPKLYCTATLIQPSSATEMINGICRSMHSIRGVQYPRGGSKPYFSLVKMPLNFTAEIQQMFALLYIFGYWLVNNIAVEPTFGTYKDIG